VGCATAVMPRTRGGCITCTYWCAVATGSDRGDWGADTQWLRAAGELAVRELERGLTRSGYG